MTVLAHDSYIDGYRRVLPDRISLKQQHNNFTVACIKYDTV